MPNHFKILSSIRLYSRLFFILIISTNVFAQDINGEWIGSFIWVPEVNEIKISIIAGENDTVAYLDLIDQNRYDIPYNVRIKSDSTFLIWRESENGWIYKFDGGLEWNVITGIYDPGGNRNGRFQLMRTSYFTKGQKMPAFAYSGLNGIPITSDDIPKNKYVLLDFWATWCGPCIDERPIYQNIYEKYRDSLEILSISLDTSSKKVQEFRQNRYEMPWLHAIEPEGWQVEKVWRYLPGGLPYAYLISPDGELLAFGEELYSEHVIQTINNFLDK